MFMVWSKDKILSYLVSLGTVTLLFVMSYAITTKNDEILKTSANAIKANEIIESNETTETNAKGTNKIMQSNTAESNETVQSSTTKLNETVQSSTTKLNETVQSSTTKLNETKQSNSTESNETIQSITTNTTKNKTK